jgi:hypothetical protein
MMLLTLKLLVERCPDMRGPDKRGLSVLSSE